MKKELSTAELTENYIQEHPNIKSCLKKDLINYSALSRLIASELDIKNKSSNDAILVAARRYQKKLEGEFLEENEIKNLLTNSEIELKNKIVVITFEKTSSIELIEQMNKKVKKNNDIFYFIEGSSTNTIITNEKYQEFLENSLKNKVIQKESKMVLLTIKSSKEIEEIPGVVAYLTTLFADNGVNIAEFISCWRDTLFIIKSEDVGRTMNFLNF